LLDLILLMGVFGVVDTWASMHWGVAAGAEFHFTTASVLVSALLDVGIFFTYMWVLEALCGATLGKAIVGVAVINDGPRNPVSASAIRNSLRLIDAFGFYLFGAMVASCSQQRRRFGDMIAGTTVIERDFRTWVKAAAVLAWVTAVSLSVFGGAHIARGEQVSTQAPSHLGRTVAKLGKNSGSAYAAVGGFRIDVHRDAPVPAAVAVDSAPPAPASTASPTTDNAVRNQ
jgi:uncharacterized RDD family membrane protein YckC